MRNCTRDEGGPFGFDRDSRAAPGAGLLSGIDRRALWSKSGPCAASRMRRKVGLGRGNRRNIELGEPRSTLIARA
jgi:hypothetical protein